MFIIVGEAPMEFRVNVNCSNCRNLEEEGIDRLPSSSLGGKGSATLFFDGQDKTFMTNCAICGDTNKDEEYIMESYTTCCNCNNQILIKDIRESVPCKTCGEVNNRAVAITRYYSQIITE